MLSKSLFAAVAVCAVQAAAAASDTYPSRDVELVVPYSAGGSVDAMARAFSRALGEAMNASVVVQNRDGAGGVIGVGAVASARPDGYTVLFGPTSPITQAPYLLDKVPYDVADIRPVCQIFQNPFVIAVREESPLRSLDELLATARKEPGGLSYGHAGVGSVPHLATANLAKAANVRFNEVAFRGDAQVIPQVLGGHVDFGSMGASTVAGKNLRVLGVLGDERLPAFPDAPPVADFGVRHAVIARNGLYVHRDVPDEIQQRLASACETATGDADFRDAAQQLHQRVTYMGAQAFGTQLEQDHKANRELIESLGLLAKSR